MFIGLVKDLPLETETGIRDVDCSVESSPWSLMSAHNALCGIIPKHCCPVPLAAYICRRLLLVPCLVHTRSSLLHRLIRLPLSPRSLPEPPFCPPPEPYSLLLTCQTTTPANCLPLPHPQPWASALPGFPGKESLCVTIMYTNLHGFVADLFCGSCVKLRSLASQ